ncbi:MAG: histidine kinase [Chitinophagia bacterium]|nr:histidine kinase [Chitinophagia bacterium]
MKTRLHHFINGDWKGDESSINPAKCQLVFAFGSSDQLLLPENLDPIRSAYPNADLVTASTAGEIIRDGVYDNSIVATAIELEQSTLKCVKTHISEHVSSFDAGLFLKEQLQSDDLSGIFIISDGLMVEGSELVRGFNHENTKNIPITGGLAGDAARFQNTYTSLNEAPGKGNIIAVGFYGDHMHIGHGSLGGWDEFGYERTITRSDKNVLFEVDEEKALDLYKRYLGSFAEQLPGSALMFPLSMRVPGADKYLIRTILATDDNESAMIFAGNMPQGSTVRMMRGDIQKLIRASATAAKDSVETLKNRKPQLTLMLSCVGRKIIMDKKVEEEVLAAEEVIDGDCAVAGFYTYGGLSPFGVGTPCELHNQTMTITTFSES